MIASHGWRNKWNVFASIRLIAGNSPIYFESRNRSRINHLIVAFVPTGMNTGVLTVIQFSVNSPALAFPCFAIRRNCNFDIIIYSHYKRFLFSCLYGSLFPLFL